MYAYWSMRSSYPICPPAVFDVPTIRHDKMALVSLRRDSLTPWHGDELPLPASHISPPFPFTCTLMLQWQRPIERRAAGASESVKRGGLSASGPGRTASSIGVANHTHRICRSIESIEISYIIIFIVLHSLCQKSTQRGHPTSDAEIKHVYDMWS